VRANKPLYLAGFLGGATEQVVQAIEGRPMTDDFCGPTSLQPLYKNPPTKEYGGKAGDDRIIDDRGNVWKEFAEVGREKLAMANGLGIEEIDELFHTPVIDRVVELVLVGVSRIWPVLARRG
jgi:hypothetical protein